MRSGLILCGVLFLLSALNVRAEPGHYLNYAILTIPPKFVAQVPLNERPVLLSEISERPSDERLDYKSGFLDWHTDESEVHGGTAPFCMKIFFFKADGDNPLVFIHIQRWFSGGKQTRHETFMLKEEFGAWKDVTKATLPKGVDRASYFKLSAASPDIEVAPYIERTRGMLYPYGACKMALRWNGKGFDKVSTKPHPIAPDY